MTKLSLSFSMDQQYEKISKSQQTLEKSWIEDTFMDIYIYIRVPYMSFNNDWLSISKFFFRVWIQCSGDWSERSWVEVSLVDQ